MSSKGPILPHLVYHRLGEIATPQTEDDGAFRFTTHCMYPSNGLVRVTVRGGSDSIVASDEGEAVGEALSAGIAHKDADRLLRRLVKDQGLRIRRGVIFTPPMPVEAAPLAVILVANAAKEAAHWLYDHFKLKRDRDFRKLLADFLVKSFEERVEHNARVTGASTHVHKFANVISFANGYRMIIDSVIHDSSSFNSRIVANLDVKALKSPSLEQRIIYDDEEEWPAADLNLLQVGATVVPFSKSEQVINRLAERVGGHMQTYQ